MLPHPAESVLDTLGRVWKRFHRQGLDAVLARWLPDTEALWWEAKAWEAERNRLDVGCWCFTTVEAWLKLRKLYPSIEV